eukprot:NODE_1379_length_1179_cov_0.658333.p1 type:complete len:266 gc:universal NODE_1379_length_1179_cov_0.658333:850-53(-)
MLFNLCGTQHIVLDEKKILITGGSSGIGKDACEKILDKYNSVKIIVVDLNKPSFDCDFYKCDLSSKDQVTKTFAQILKSHGTPDVMVFNAGIQYPLLIDQISDEQYERIINVNFFNLFYAVKPFLAGLKDRKSGHIIFTCSVCSFIYAPGAIPYCASKAATFSFANGLRSELQGFNIHVSTLLPGHIKTNLFREFTVKFKWLMPSLEPEYVGGSLLEIIEKDYSQQWMRPLYTLSGPLLQLLPPTFALWLQEFLGGDVAILNKQK